MTRAFAHCLAAIAISISLAACGGDREPASSGEASRERQLDERIRRAERRLDRQRERDEAPPARRGGSSSETALRGFGNLAAALGGEVGVTVGAPGTREAPSRLGNLAGGSAWSTIKVPIAIRVLERAGGPNGLRAAQRSQIERALTASDNAAAAQLFRSLGDTSRAAADVTRVLRQAGDRSTRVSTRGRGSFSPYGQTEWPLLAQHRFMAAFAGGCVGDAPTRRHVLGLMGRVTSDTWGLGSTGLAAHWKGGWGPGTDGRYLARQMGVLDVGRQRLVVTLAVVPSDGEFASAQRMATRVAKWIARRGAAVAGPATGC